MKADELVRFARAYGAQKLPWFAPALFRCQIHFSEKVPVAAIDKHFNIYFNPKVIEEIDQRSGREDGLAQIGFIWIHEISHLLREHGDRAIEIDADASLWNMAADLEINDSHWEGLKMPDAFPGLYPAQFKFPVGGIAEFYYKKLLELQDEQIDQRLQQPAKDRKCQRPDEGSGVHGQCRPWEVEGTGEGQELDEVEVEIVRRSVAQEMENHKKQGKIPGGWERWAEGKLHRKIDWRRVLRHRMSMAINRGVGNRIDYSFRRPSRRHSVYHPVLPPSLNGDLSARIACVVDTSGSMGPGELAQAVAEICEVLEVFQVPVTIIPCDARAYDPIRITRRSDHIKLRKLPGGGGTNMIVGIEAALALKPQPDSVLVLTDGYTPFPQKLYKTPVVFGIFKRLPQQKISGPPNPPWRPDSVVEILLSEL